MQAQNCGTMPNSVDHTPTSPAATSTGDIGMTPDPRGTTRRVTWVASPGAMSQTTTWMWNHGGTSRTVTLAASRPATLEPKSSDPTQNPSPPMSRKKNEMCQTRRSPSRTPKLASAQTPRRPNLLASPRRLCPDVSLVQQGPRARHWR